MDANSGAPLPAPTAPAPPPLPPLSPSQRSPWRLLGGFTLDLLIAIAIMLGVSLLVSLLWGVYEGIRLGATAARDGVGVAQAAAGAVPPAGLMVLMAVLGTSLAALALYYGRRRADAIERAASWRAALTPSTWGWALLTGVAVFAFSTLVSTLAQAGGIRLTPSNTGLIESVLNQHPALLFVFAVVLAPSYEELLFRRVLFGRFWAGGRAGLGVLLSAAAFALMHELPGTSGNGLIGTVLLWLTYGAMGAAFAWVYRRTGTLWAAIGAHGVNNCIAIGLLYAQH